MRKLYIPQDESELVFLKSVLEADQIPFFVQNDTFGSLYSGAYMNYFNAKTIMVPEDFYDEAKEIISSVIKDAEFPVFEVKEPPKVSDIFSNIMSFLSLGLYNPSKKKDNKSD